MPLHAASGLSLTHDVVLQASLAREFSEIEARATQAKSSSNAYSSGEDSDDEDTSGSRSSRRQGGGPRPINGVAYEEFTVGGSLSTRYSLVRDLWGGG